MLPTFNKQARTINAMTNTLVSFTSIPSIERPLFLPQYVSAAPAIAPSPADLPSCIRIMTVNAILTMINNTVNIIFKTPTIYTSYVLSFCYVHNFSKYIIANTGFQPQILSMHKKGSCTRKSVAVFSYFYYHGSIINRIITCLRGN